MGGRHAEPAHIKLLMDCAEICQTSANFMLRNSEFSAKICGTCAAICEVCYDSCEKFEGRHMKHCAENCRKAPKSCMDMAEG